jgi:hypothetical protein
MPCPEGGHNLPAEAAGTEVTMILQGLIAP